MATKIWKGTAVDIAQVDTLTVSGTWAAADEAGLIINNNRLALTVGSSTASNEIAELISNAVNATSATGNLANDETRNLGGQQIPEFTEVTASYSAGVVTLTGNTRGVPFTMTEEVTTASTGDLTLATVTSATGKNWFNNAANWDTNTAPVTGDKLIFTDSDIDCLYGIEQGVAVTNVTIQIDASYTGAIGLPKRNSIGYDEYRQRYLEITTADTDKGVIIGSGPGAGSSRLKFDFRCSDAKVIVVTASAPAANEKAAVDIEGGGGTMELRVYSGTVAVGALGANAPSLSALEIGYESDQRADAYVYLGTRTTVTTIKKNGGELYMDMASGTVTLMQGKSGLTTVQNAVAFSQIDVEGTETLRYMGTGTIGKLNVRERGVVEFTRDLNGRTVTAADVLSEDAIIRDPFKTVTWTNGIDINNFSNLSNINVGVNVRLTIGAVS